MERHWRKEGGEGEKERGTVPLLWPPTDTGSVTIETLSTLNLIIVSTPSFYSSSLVSILLYSLSLSLSHLQELLPTVDCNCYSIRDKERGRERGVRVGCGKAEVMQGRG